MRQPGLRSRTSNSTPPSRLEMDRMQSAFSEKYKITPPISDRIPKAGQSLSFVAETRNGRKCLCGVHAQAMLRLMRVSILSGPVRCGILAASLLVQHGFAFDGSGAPAMASPSARTVLDFDDDWRFSKGDFVSAMMPAFDDASWQTMSVPHDWSSGLIPTAGPDGRALSVANGATDIPSRPLRRRRHGLCTPARCA